MRAAPDTAGRLGLPQLELLYEEPGLPSFDLPDALAAAYGGLIGFLTPRLCVNVTTSVDGVFTRPGRLQPSAARSEHARFLSGLLRACADAVLVGGDAGVGRLDTRLSAEDAYPPAAPWYARLRRLRGCSPRPQPVVLLSGDALDRAPLEFADGTLVLASERSARSLRERLPASTALIELTESSAEPLEVVGALRSRGYELILCEGCPTFVGAFLEAGVVDEIFLAQAPLLAGRSGRGRPNSQDGQRALLLDRAVPARLLSLRRGGSHVFSRYELDGRRAWVGDEAAQRARELRRCFLPNASAPTHARHDARSSGRMHTRWERVPLEREAAERARSGPGAKRQRTASKAQAASASLSGGGRSSNGVVEPCREMEERWC